MIDLAGRYDCPPFVHKSVHPPGIRRSIQSLGPLFLPKMCILDLKYMHDAANKLHVTLSLVDGGIARLTMWPRYSFDIGVPCMAHQPPYTLTKDANLMVLSVGWKCTAFTPGAPELGQGGSMDSQSVMEVFSDMPGMPSSGSSKPRDAQR